MSISLVQVGCSVQIQQKEDLGEVSATNFSMECSDGELDSFSVIGGKRVASKNPVSQSVVLLMAQVFIPDKGESLVKCTGTLISEDVVLTAAHCVDFKGLQEEPNRLTVVFGVDPGCAITAKDKTKYTEAQAFKIHDNWKEANPEKGSDMALIRLKNKAPEGFSSAKVFKKQISAELKKNIWGVGFGITTRFGEQDTSSPLMRAARLQAPRKAFGNLLKLDQSRGQSLCSGDSGGPLILATQNGNRVAGVASFVEPLNLDSERCGGYVTYNLISNELAWLRKTFTALSPQAVSPF